MKIFFTCSARDIDKYQDYYRQIRDSIRSLGHTLTKDWIDQSIEIAETDEKHIPSSTLYQNFMSAILASELVVCDATVRSMSIGHQITFALQKKKPVLLLQSALNKQNPEELFINGAKSPLLVIKIYHDKKEIPTIIKRFIQRFESSSKTRFNLVINKAMDSYIEWAAFHYKRSKTEIIQDAINEKMEKDQYYEQYLDM